ncbi:FAD dependent oxidoreductase TIGR03364 [Leucobacter exalbidus]|uniref:FAD dependent oxidoreductase TIGR03364 n=1 Tax=Leucobacter exalbidus TaxID=662960 RepID=A0A940PYA8_9MICO|nr:TIGR03364 family FAD-dependent oxidoreductase [Leucobacter exalbidus]MBP1327594.1 FAD dependent oxidoreductase TIGR03364 [Leucobacter exalbidus]
MSATTYDLVVVGGGIVGLGAAYAAVKRGQRVLVIERGASATGASIRNFGHLCSGVHSGDAREYALVARELWLQLSRDADFWVRESGTLIVARHADELALLEAAANESSIKLLDRAEVEATSPVAPGVSVGGGIVDRALQTNPRTALYAITNHLAALGVEFQFRTAVTRVQTGLVETTRGKVSTAQVVVAVNHDLDHLYPELAEEAGVERCALDMMRVQATLRHPMNNPILTGWSMLRYHSFAKRDEAKAVRERLHSERPDLAAIDINQMYTQLPDGSLLVGDTHTRDLVASPFQSEDAQQVMLDEAQALFGIEAPRVIERWQGVYASAGGSGFLSREIEPGVRALIVTSGNGMTCGLGFAERELQPIF